MKKVFLVILMMISLNAFSDYYFFRDVRSGESVVANVTTSVPIYITDARDAEQRGRVITYTVIVTAGTIKFGVGSIGANQAANGVGVRLIFTCENGQLYFQAASGLDTFTVTAA